MIDKIPTILKNVFPEEMANSLKKSFYDYKRYEFQAGFARYIIGNKTHKELDNAFISLIPLARKTFNSKTLLPTYALFAHYEGFDPAPSLYKHKDDNACTYTIDLCLYQNDSWDLWVEDRPYTLKENEALAYYGNDQLHWREGFPNPGKQHVAMIFFHFAEPDHWWFTKGPSYLSVIRNQIIESEWGKNNHATRQ